MIYEGEQRIEVSVGPRHTSVEVKHVEYFRDFPNGGYAKARIEFGLAPQPLVTRGHLQLVKG